MWYIHFLLDLLNNPEKFQLNWIRPQNFLLKLFYTAMTFTYHIYGVWKNLKVFCHLWTIGQLAGQPTSLTLIITHSHFPCEAAKGNQSNTNSKTETGLPGYILSRGWIWHEFLPVVVRLCYHIQSKGLNTSTTKSTASIQKKRNEKRKTHETLHLLSAMSTHKHTNCAHHRYHGILVLVNFDNFSGEAKRSFFQTKDRFIINYSYQVHLKVN